MSMGNVRIEIKVEGIPEVIAWLDVVYDQFSWGKSYEPVVAEHADINFSSRNELFDDRISPDSFMHELNSCGQRIIVPNYRRLRNAHRRFFDE